MEYSFAIGAGGVNEKSWRVYVITWAFRLASKATFNVFGCLWNCSRYRTAM